MVSSLSDLYIMYIRYALEQGLVRKAYAAVQAGLERDPGHLKLERLNGEIEEKCNLPQALLGTEGPLEIEKEWRGAAIKLM